MVLKITNLHILRYLPTCWLYLLERYTIDNQRCTHTTSGSTAVVVENRDVSHKKVGNGFADVAGMEDLKTQLQSDVIDLLQHPKEAKDLGLSIPNGLLFYGPPGCGKTFFIH